MKKIILLLGILFISALYADSTKIQKTQVPGYYRFMVGNYEIISIYDGYSDMPMDVYKGIDAAKAEEFVRKEYAHTSGSGKNFSFKLSVNTFLINTGRELILIDTGSGNSAGPSMGDVKKNIELAGYKAEDVNKIIFTHLHPDHVGGLSENGKLLFPNAVIYVNDKEMDFWLKNPDFKKELKDVLNGYKNNKKYKALKDGTEIVTGIKAVLLPGHTIGHTGYEINSGGQKLLIWGDITHGYEIQFADPDVTTAFDYNQNQARETRKALMEKVAKDGTMIAGSHLPFPGIGHVSKNTDGAGYRWIPVQYIPLD
jgi:glyoxylase-like metal-dependent hydrolase (beta-lactamase superfamily II)